LHSGSSGSQEVGDVADQPHIIDWQQGHLHAQNDRLFSILTQYEERQLDEQRVLREFLVEIQKMADERLDKLLADAESRRVSEQKAADERLDKLLAHAESRRVSEQKAADERFHQLLSINERLHSETTNANQLIFSLLKAPGASDQATAGFHVDEAR
jgi:hypothetical protein